MALIILRPGNRRTRAESRELDAEYLVANLLWFLAERSCPTPAREHRFHPTRKWRFDLAWPALQLAVEVDGGTWIAGGHSRGAGQRRDAEKQNEAVILGWRVLRVTSDLIEDGTAADQITRAIAALST